VPTGRIARPGEPVTSRPPIARATKVVILDDKFVLCRRKTAEKKRGLGGKGLGPRLTGATGIDPRETSISPGARPLPGTPALYRATWRNWRLTGLRPNRVSGANRFQGQKSADCNRVRNSAKIEAVLINFPSLKRRRQLPFEKIRRAADPGDGYLVCSGGTSNLQ